MQEFFAGHNQKTYVGERNGNGEGKRSSCDGNKLRKIGKDVLN